MFCKVEILNDCDNAKRWLFKSCEDTSGMNHRLTRTRGSEKIAVRAGTGQFKDENVLVNLVDEKPVGRNMAFAVISPVIAEKVVAVCGRKGFAIVEFRSDLFSTVCRDG